MASNLIHAGEKTTDLFHRFVPNAEKVSGASQFELVIDGRTHTIRVKRGKEAVNQNHLYNGEPLVVHIPSSAESQTDRWYVMDVEWLLRYAITNPDSNQHTVHALDCFMFSKSELSLKDPVAPDDLASECEKAIVASRAPNIQRAVREVQRARDYAKLRFDSACDRILEMLDIELTD